MGVMLTLDKPIARLRRRGQHTRTPEEQACLDAFAAFLRYDAPSAGRSLSRLATTVLASRLLPAARALADAVDLVLADQPLAAQAAGALPLPAHPLPAHPLAAHSLAAHPLAAHSLAAQPLAAPLSSDAAAYDRAAYDRAAHGSAAHSGAHYDSAARERPGRDSGPPGARTVALNFTVSPPCLLGMCRDGVCRSPLCEHACHSRPA